MEIRNDSPSLYGLDVAFDTDTTRLATTTSGLATQESLAVDGEVLVADAGDDASLFREQFAEKASDPAAFHAFMEQVFGPNYDRAEAESMRQAALAGDFSFLPEVRYVPSDTLGGANGAYDAESGVVYLNEELAGTPLAAQTFVEEAGHHLDTLLNATDSAGDEGELFRRVLSGEALTGGQVAAIRAENDKGTIVIDGRKVEVEFWNPIKAVSDAASAVGGAISDAASAVGGAISDAAGAVGGAISDAAGAVWGGLKTAVDWMGPRLMDVSIGLGTGVVDTFVGVGHNLWESVETFGGGIGKFFTGDFSGGLKDMGLGLLKVGQTVVDAVLVLGGRAISAVQTLVGLEPPARGLSDAEIDALRQVYGDSIDYSSVRIKEGSAGLFSLSGRAFTHDNVIYIPKGDLPLAMDLLVHEMAHVWQHQNGGTDYMSEALYAQYLGDGYEFEQALEEGKSWSEMNPEQQGEFIQTAFRSGYDFTPGSGDTFFVNGVDYTAELESALAQIRAGEGAP